MTMDMPQEVISWNRPRFFKLRKLFNRVIFGNLNQHYIAAASRGDTPAIYTWLDRGADPYCSDNAALHAAHINGHTNTVENLLSLGANPAALGGDCALKLYQIKNSHRRAAAYKYYKDLAHKGPKNFSR